MPIIKSFEIRNFKGIDKVTITLEDRSNVPVITLVGLNESGKTTILEALSYFVSSDSRVSSLFKAKTKSNNTDIIPISKRAAFSESIDIQAIVRLEESDLKKIEALAADEGIEIDLNKLTKPFELTKSLVFKDSIAKENMSFYEFDLWARKKGEIEFKECFPDESNTSFWNTVANKIESELPSIAYFPTFLVDIPNKIYLEEHENETPANQHYRSIFQSIMEGIDGGLDLEKHVSERIDLYRKPNSANWVAQLLSNPTAQLINSVFQKISFAVTREVIGGWRRVFSKDTTAKHISVDWNIDTGKHNIPYASFMVSDGEHKYEISERSLGFRWFFSFLLFTAFKGTNKKSTLLIFDEPAANLHAKAQAELLENFEKIATNGTKIIYSTHSHHMINPRWLGGAYIIENTALNFESEDTFDFSPTPTNIKATRYKEFISNYPSRSSYFQPVIECLDYVAPQVIGDAPYVLVEGISDYYALTLAHKLSEIKLHYRILPGVGSGASGPLISLMMGRGEKFLILLDDDEAGRKESIRYKDNWYLKDNSIMTLAAIDSDFSGMALEKLLDEDTLNLISNHYEILVRPSKKQIGWYLAEMCAHSKENKLTLSSSTLNNLIKILESLNSKISFLHSET